MKNPGHPMKDQLKYTLELSMSIVLLGEGSGRCIIRNKVRDPSLRERGHGKVGETPSGQEKGKSCLQMVKEIAEEGEEREGAQKEARS